MVLRYFGTRSKDEYERFIKIPLVKVGELSVFSDYYDKNHKVTEPTIWIPINNYYDVWQLIGEEVIQGASTEKQFKTICTNLLEQLYGNGFSSGNFQQ